MSSTAIPDLQAVANDIRLVRIEPCARRIRVFVAGVAVADTTRALYLFEQGHLPVYYLPFEDLRADLLEPTSTSTHCPRKGDASYWSIKVGDDVRTDALWGYPNPLPECPDISGYVAFYWNRVDAWFEEDDEVFVHPRDPYKRIDVLQSSRHVVVSVDGVVLADTHRPKLLFETGLPVRYYIPKIDLRLELVRTSDTVTRCPYKGIASYLAFDIADETRPDLAWTYVAPIPEIPKIENHVAFFNERVDITVDGVLQERPVSPWS
jgi:uncharacterized protein (DUF427 family)